jgi:16S rRNA (adenine(1408)-N(1))-methyltransferase
MREASDRASRKPSRGGAPNAMFLAGTLAELAACTPLAGAVAEIHVTLPWGSLLRAAIEPEPSFVTQLCMLLASQGSVRLLLSVTPRDAANGLTLLDCDEVARLWGAYARLGITIATARLATSDDVDVLGSSWARRLGIPDQREAWLLVGERSDRR